MKEIMSFNTHLPSTSTPLSPIPSPLLDLCLLLCTGGESMQRRYRPGATNLRSSAFICGSFFAKAPQINKLLFIKLIHLSLRTLHSGKEKFIINNELVRTDTNSIYSEFVRVRFSSLLLFISVLFFIVIYEPGFMADFAVMPMLASCPLLDSHLGWRSLASYTSNKYVNKIKQKILNISMAAA